MGQFAHCLGLVLVTKLVLSLGHVVVAHNGWYHFVHVVVVVSLLSRLGHYLYGVHSHLAVVVAVV